MDDNTIVELADLLGVEYYFEMGEEFVISTAVSTIRRLQTENAELRAAVEAVEWPLLGDDTGADPMCPWCMQLRIEGHAPDCQRQQALGLQAGEG